MRHVAAQSDANARPPVKAVVWETLPLKGLQLESRQTRTPPAFVREPYVPNMLRKTLHTEMNNRKSSSLPYIESLSVKKKKQPR